MHRVCGNWQNGAKRLGSSASTTNFTRRSVRCGWCVPTTQRWQYVQRMTIREKQAALIARYSIIEDAQERLAAIVARGRKWPGICDAEKCDERRVQGCVSQVWLVGESDGTACRFRMSADSPLVQGLAALICDLYDGGTAEEIATVEPEVIEALGLDRQISPTRLNGLANIRRTIREFASAHSA